VPAQAHRLSLVYTRVTDLVLPRHRLDDRLREGFAPNAWSEEQVHGQVGRARLEVAVPPGTAVTLMGRTTGATCFQGLSGSLLLVNARADTIEELAGDLFLLHAHVGTVRQVQGNVLQFCHDRDGSGHWDKGKRLRPPPTGTRMLEIQGDIDLDVGHVDLQVQEPVGQVSIRNRTGNTAIAAEKWVEGKRWRLESASGRIAVQLTDELFQDRVLAASTLSGELDYAAIDREDLMKANCPNYMLFSTYRPYPDLGGKRSFKDADIQVVSEGGDIQLTVR
jgi:hypothetical protein